MLNVSELWEPIKISGVIVGAIVAYLEYDAYQDEQKLNRAIGYAGTYQVGHILDAHLQSDPAVGHIRQSIDDSMKTYDMPKAHYLPMIEHATSAQSLMESIEGQTDQNSEGVVKRIESLHTLKLAFRPVANCALQNVCDTGILCKSFFSDVQSFEQQYRNIYQNLGREWLDAELQFATRFQELCVSEADRNMFD